MEAANIRWIMSRNRPVNVEVSLKEVGGDVNRLIRKFIKKCKKERIIENYLDRMYYEKKSVKKRKEKLKKRRNVQKAEQQRNKKLSIR